MNQKKKFLTIFVLVLTFCSFILSAPSVRADSGFDNSYGGGSSSSSGGSYYSGSSGGIQIPMSPIFLIPLAIAVIAIVIYAKKQENKQPGQQVATNTAKESLSSDMMTQAELASIDPDFDREEFGNFAFETYKEIQTAWMNFELEKIRLIVSDELYNMYEMQLATLEASKQQNKMLGIVKVSSGIISLKKEGNVETSCVQLKVKCLDYIINQESKEVLRGDASRKLEVTYHLTFTRTIGSIGNHEHYKEISCPNCGAMTKINASGVCEYCQGVLVSKNHEWVLTKKETVGQRKE